MAYRHSSARACASLCRSREQSLRPRLLGGLESHPLPCASLSAMPPFVHDCCEKFAQEIVGPQRKPVSGQDGGREVRTPNLRVWNPMRRPLRHTPLCPRVLREAGAGNSEAAPRPFIICYAARPFVYKMERGDVGLPVFGFGIRCGTHCAIARLFQIIASNPRRQIVRPRRGVEKNFASTRWGQGGSNSQPSGLESDALPIAPYPRLIRSIARTRAGKL